MRKEINGGFREIIDKFEGMDGLTDPTKLNEVQLALLENFTLKSYGNIGSLVSRNGFTRYNANQVASGGTGVGSLYESTLNGTDYMIAQVINGTSSAIYYRDSPYTSAFTAITGASGVAYKTKLNYASFKDKVYIANRADGTTRYGNTVWNGTTTGIFDMGCPPPSSRAITLTGSNSNGRLTNSAAYYYYITFLYDGYQESAIMSYSVITMGVAEDTVTITNLPTAPLDGNANARITARKIYRLKTGVDIAYYLDTVNNNTDTSYVDYKADNELVYTIDLDIAHNVNAPYYAKYLAIHKERMVLGNTYSPNIFTAPTGASITLTGADSGGSMGSGIYKYRFYFENTIYDGGNYYNSYLTPYVEKTVDMSAFTGTDNKVTIDFTALAVRNYFDSIRIERTAVGTSDFIWLANVAFTTGSYVDTIADVLRGVTTVGFNLTKVEDTTLSFPNNIIVSDAGKPDLFSTIEVMTDGTLIPAGNEWNVGEPITGIHSEENRIIIFGNKNIYELDTSSQSRQFWRLNKIVSGIGADDGLQCQVGNGYCFVNSGKKNFQEEIVENIYYWDGRSKPVIINDAIFRYCSDNAISEFLDIKYDDTNNCLWVLTENTGQTLTYIFLYYFEDNTWEIITNATEMNFTTMAKTKYYGIILGNGDGYIHRQSEAFQDTIANTARTFTTKLRTKTWELYDTDLRPRRLRADITASTTGITPVLKTAVDGTLNSGDNMTALASGFNRPIQTTFTNAQATSYRQVYFQLEMTANVQQKVHGLMIDFRTDHEDNGGR